MATKDHHDWVSATFEVDLTRYHGHDSHGTDHTRVALRLGDTSPEVSELQTALHIKDTGVFDQATHDAVAAFQKANGLKADGIAGPHTLKALHKHHAEPAAVPHAASHAEHHDAAKPGKSAHWMIGSGGAADMVDDDLVLFVVAEGDIDLTGRTAIISATPEGGRTATVHVNIGPVQTKATKQQGAVHPVTVENLTSFAPSPLKDGKEHSYKIEARLEAGLGGEAWHGTIKVRNMQDILDDHNKKQMKAHWIAKGAGTADMVDDDLVLFVVADGDGNLEGQTVVVKVTPEGGRTTPIHAAIGKVQTPATAKMGAVYPVTIENLTLACKPPAGHGQTHTYNIEATLDAKLGGETWHGPLTVLTQAST